MQASDVIVKIVTNAYPKRSRDQNDRTGQFARTVAA
jgi:hypothetical protein